MIYVIENCLKVCDNDGKIHAKLCGINECVCADIWLENYEKAMSITKHANFHAKSQSCSFHPGDLSRMVKKI